MSLEPILASIEQVDVDEAQVREFSREAQHFELGFNLLREGAQYVTVAGCVSVGEVPSWSVAEAVLGGHLVRMHKLLRFFLEEAIQNRAELIWVITRLLTECIINTRYLVKLGSPEVINSYIHQSLQHERELRAAILANIETRGGQRLPVEERMLASIDRTFARSQMTIEEVPTKRIRNWAGKNLFEKAQAVGLDQAYISIFGGPSRNIHGGWHDLLQHHLDWEDSGQFSPRFEYSRPRPHLPLVLSVLIPQAIADYARALDHPDLEPLLARLTNLETRARVANELHELFLSEPAA